MNARCTPRDRRRSTLAHHASERGQAIVEFLVACVVLVPLLFAIVLMGRLQDVRASTIQSARYAAFAQAFADVPRDALQEEVRARFFGDPAHPLRAEGRAGTRSDTNPHWVDLARAANPLVARPEDATLRVANASPPGAAADALTAAVGGVERVTALTGGRFDLERRGYFGADVDVRIAGNSLLRRAGAPPLTLQAHARVLGRDWSSSGPAETAGRAAALVPTSSLRGVRTLVLPLAWALSLLEPAFRDLCLARVDPELVPVDRLGLPGSDETGRWRTPCE